MPRHVSLIEVWVACWRGGGGRAERPGPSGCHPSATAAARDLAGLHLLTVEAGRWAAQQEISRVDRVGLMLIKSLRMLLPSLGPLKVGICVPLQCLSAWIDFYSPPVRPKQTLSSSCLCSSRGIVLAGRSAVGRE